LENLHAQAEILELRANPKRQAIGTVVESKLDRGRGPVITVLVQNGTLKKGDLFISGAEYGRVRALVADDGRQVDEAGPSIPVEVLGASASPLAGDDFFVLTEEAEARRTSETRHARMRLKNLTARGGAAPAALTLETFSDMVKTGVARELPLIIKGDVQGSVEAVSESLAQLSMEEVRTKIIHRGVGAITENDVQLAVASGAIVVGFNVRADARASAVVESAGVQIIYSRVIYELADQVKSALLGMLAPKFKETTLGRVEVRQTFRVPKIGMVAGSYVVDGVVQRGALVRLLSDNRVIYEGKMGSLRRFKDDVKEVQAGYECGIGIEGYADIKDGDVIEVYKVEEVRPTLQ
jgi:translation initiation factor IF-2